MGYGCQCGFLEFLKVLSVGLLSHMVLVLSSFARRGMGSSSFSTLPYRPRIAKSWLKPYKELQCRLSVGSLLSETLLWVVVKFKVPFWVP